MASPPKKSRLLSIHEAITIEPTAPEDDPIVIDLNPDDESTDENSPGEELYHLVKESLVPLGDEAEAALEELLASEETVQNLVESKALFAPDFGAGRSDGTRQQNLEGPLAVAGGLALLAIAGTFTAVAKDVIDSYSECTKLGNPDPITGNLSSVDRAAILKCVTLISPGTTFDAIKTTIFEGGKQVVEFFLPTGKVKTTIRILNAGDDIQNIEDLIGVKPGCLTDLQEKNGALEASIRTFPDQSELLYIGRSEDGVFDHVPEGDWAFFAFAPNHARVISPCLRVEADQTTEVEMILIPLIDITPELLAENDEGTLTLPEDEDSGPDPATSFAGEWHSEETCDEPELPFRDRWIVSLTQDGSMVTGTISFHACPGGGRGTYEVVGQATGEIFINLDGTRISGQGPLGNTAPNFQTFTVRIGEAPDPNFAP